MSNHPRIISVTPVTKGNRKYGWNVVYRGRVLGERQVTTTRTTNLKTGAALKKPVSETHTVHDVPMSGVISRIIKRRKTLRKMGVKI